MQEEMLLVIVDKLQCKVSLNDMDITIIILVNALVHVSPRGDRFRKVQSDFQQVQTARKGYPPTKGKTSYVSITLAT